MTSGFAACALAAVALGAPTRPFAGPAPLTAGERAAMLDTLRGSEEWQDAPASGLDDETLTAMILRHAQAETGQRLNPLRVDSRWAISPRRRDLAAELRQAREQRRLTQWLAELPPPFSGYAALRALRCRYAALVDAGGWPSVPEAPVLRREDRHPVVVVLRRRLATEGYLPEAGVSDLLDQRLEDALVRFQLAHGLKPDGVVGPSTRAALNVTAEDRLVQIDANLERWRWMPHDLPLRRIEVHVPAARAVLFEGASESLAMKAVVGRPGNPTPMFASKVEAVVFNPPWRVPAQIARKEIAPRAAADPGYLARHHFALSNGRLVQSPGPQNALGRVKFDLASPFGVYLHDTPARDAFERTTRTLSHGCIRLEKPVELAEALLSSQGVTAQAVETAIRLGRTQRFALRDPVPLYVLHFTAEVGPDGLAVFWPDIYGWDRKLAIALRHGVATDGGVSPRRDRLCR